MIIEILLWTAIGLIIYSYVAYPVILSLFSLFKKSEVLNNLPGQDLPFISIVMSVHNEEFILEKKINSLIKLEYPADKIELIVGSDASNDSTDTILTEISLRYKNLTYKCFSKRMGKPAVINELVRISGGDIIIITDANVLPEKNCLRLMANRFADTSIGLVDPKTEYVYMDRVTDTTPETFYNSYESWVKSNEGSLMGKMMGPSGGFYALRKKLYTTVPENFLVDDFYINMNVLLSGSKSVRCNLAMVKEIVTDSSSEEFRRKVRIATGNFQNLRKFSYILLKPWKRLYFTYVSHKVIRWISPLLFLLALFSNLLLFGKSNIYNVLFYVQLIFLLLPALDFTLRKIHIRLTTLRIISHFIYMNLALLIGLFKSLGGSKSGIWKPTKRI